MSTEIVDSHQKTYNAVFQHPVSRNLKWVEVRAMLVALCDSVEEHGDVLKAARNGKFLTLRKPTRSGMGDISELMKVRHFLVESGATVPAPAPAADGIHLLVVLDHRMARIYRTELHGSVPQRIAPFDPSGSGRHLHNVEDDSNGQRKPEQKAFYDAIVKAIQGAKQILLFGSATGASSAMDHLLAELKNNHKELFGRVVGSIVLDWQHLTEDQLLAKAREFYASIAKS